MIAAGTGASVREHHLNTSSRDVAHAEICAAAATVNGWSCNQP